VKRILVTASMPHRVLEKMAKDLRTDFADRKGRKDCKTKVVEGIQHRHNLHDKIWLFGSQNEVTHAVLTDANNNVVVDSLAKSGGEFKADKGYTWSKDADDTVTDECVSTISVGHWFKQYLEPEGFQWT
jgi:hypothetical protein